MTQAEREEWLVLDSLGLLSDCEKRWVRSLGWESAREDFDLVVEYLAYYPSQTLPAPHLKAKILDALERRGSPRGGNPQLPLLTVGAYAPEACW